MLTASVHVNRPLRGEQHAPAENARLRIGGSGLRGERTILYNWPNVGSTGHMEGMARAGGADASRVVLGRDRVTFGGDCR
jgi:hypothetical protein